MPIAFASVERPAGRDLQRVIDTLGDWGAQWAFGDPRPTELDPIVLLWWMRRRVCHNKINQRRVIQFDFHGLQRSYWLLIDPAEASVCLQHPGFDIDVVIRSPHPHGRGAWVGSDAERVAVLRLMASSYSVGPCTAIRRASRP